MGRQTCDTGVTSFGLLLQFPQLSKESKSGIRDPSTSERDSDKGRLGPVSILLYVDDLVITGFIVSPSRLLWIEPSSFTLIPERYGKSTYYRQTGARLSNTAHFLIPFTIVEIEAITQNLLRQCHTFVYP